MIDLILLWGAFLACVLLGLVILYKVRRARHHAAWKAKRPIHVGVKRQGSDSPDEQP